jgi:Protein of unknown function (DUF2782)
MKQAISYSTLVFCGLMVFANVTGAQTNPTQPKKAEIPPPPVGTTVLDESLEPVVTIRQTGEGKVEEYRVRGKLTMLKVVPEGAAPYFMVDRNGDGLLTRMENVDSGMLIPRWILMEF